MKRIIRFLAGAVCASLVLSSDLFISSSNVWALASGEVAINEKNFPDANFRRYVSTECDTNGDGVLSQAEIDATDTVNINSKKISSLTGIEFFTSLECLYCYDNQLTSLDLSKNPELDSVWCAVNQLTSIDVSNSTKLTYLSCGDNQLTSLDVSNNPEIYRLEFDKNQIANIDLSKNPLLKILVCTDNRLTSLDVSKNPLLWWLECGNNQISSLDLSKNPELESLFCSVTQLTNLDLSKNPKLQRLNCSITGIASLDISSNELISYAFNNGEYVTYSYELGEMIGWYLPENFIYTAPHTTITANGEILHVGTGTPSLPPVPPTPIPTVGPIPTVVPTVVPAQSVGSFVDRCYSVALGRDADEGGYNYWLDALNNGEICGAQAGYGFIFSGEYANKETTNDEFVTDLYSMYFGRTPDEGGFNYWVGLLNSGASREEIFAGFANSTEFDNLCSDYGVVTGAYLVGVPNDQQGGVNAFVARLYNICLTRKPDMAGQSGWAEKLIAGEVTGTTCSYGFVFSPEFIGKEPSNEEFVACMYRAFFGREPDMEGFTAWVQNLIDGASYEDVFDGFSGSAEFANLCASYGINP